MPWDTSAQVLLLIILLQQLITETTSKQNDTSCPRPRVGMCVCKWTGPFVKVICSGLNVMPENLPVNTTHLKITNGAIQEVPENILLPLNHLYYLWLQNNNISKGFHLPKTISTLVLRNNSMNPSRLYGMFDGLTNLNYLDLSFNPSNGSFIPGTFSSLKNVETLLINNCQIKTIEKDTFSGMIQLKRLNINDNDIQVLKKGAFKGVKSGEYGSLFLFLAINKISHIEDGTFKDIIVIGTLNLEGNRLTILPDIRGISPTNSILKFKENSITDISAITKAGIKTITELSLNFNNISEIPATFFKNTRILTELDLSNNRIKEIPDRFLENSPTLNLLILCNNHIEKIYKDSFIGLKNVQGLYLFNNHLTQLPDGVFANLDLQYLFLNGNRFRSLTGRPFKGMKKTNTIIYLFENNITHIGDDFLNDLGNQTTLYFECKDLKGLPHIQRSSLAQITCNQNNLDWIRHINNEVAESLAHSGFFCNSTARNNWNCIPCKAGSYQDAREGDLCTKCSAGGFYQDQVAQVYCKKCSIGTFVHPNNTPATTPLSCQACPQGTQTSEKAGYRACKCLPNFYRFDRFGRCFPCPSEAFKCEKDYASLSLGFFWKWQNETHEKQYSKFIENLQIENREFVEGTWKYEGALPSPHKCPRNSCLGGLNSSCKIGYHGPLCALCESNYYNRMNRCIHCPSKLWAGFQVVLVVVLFVAVLLALLWGDRKKIDNESGRTIADKILSCFKIVVGFYQVMAGVYSAFSDITWPSSVIWMQKILHFIQLNILQIAPLSCITPRLSFNVLQQFAIVVALNIIVVSLILFYLVIRIKLLKRKKSCSQNQIDEWVAKTKSSCIRNICVFLFATYPKTCTSIIQVFSINCIQLCFDKKHAHCDSYLRSDLSVQCLTPEHNIYSRIATALLVYPIGFPVVLLILVWKYIYTPSSVHKNNPKADFQEVNEDRVKSFEIDCIPSPRESPFRSGLSLFSENYKSNCWYWEALEMARKLVLVSGLTLIGRHSRTQVGLGAIISAVFAILYVYKRPIKNKFENLLQTVALMAIFLNLGIGVMLKTSDHQMSPVTNKENDNVGVSVMLIIINVAVIGIVTVAVLKVIAMQLLSCCSSTYRTCGCIDCCEGCLSCCLNLLLPLRLRREDESRKALLQGVHHL